MKTISIIIPIYNTVKYLEKCLESICNQTYKELEIICIDDGSTDGSFEILKKYAYIDKRIIVVHQKNRGQSNARNTALKIMSGDFVAFCDSDDWIEPNMYETLLHKMVETDADLVASNYFIDTDNDSRIMNNINVVSKDVFGRKELLRYVFIRDLYKGFTAYLVCKLFKKELFYNNNELIFFDESLRIAEDVLYFTRLSANVKRVYYISEAYYHYYQREDSVVHTMKITFQMNYLMAYQKIIEYLELEMMDEDILVWVKRFMAYHAKNIAAIAYEQKNYDALKTCQKFMKEYELEYVDTNRQYNERIIEFYKILNLV